jgi:hypothetical protein
MISTLATSPKWGKIKKKPWAWTFVILPTVPKKEHSKKKANSNMFGKTKHL